MSTAHGTRHRGRNGRTLITSAQPGASNDLKSRQIRYGVTMAFRVACFVSMVWVPSPWRWLLLAGAVVLPYVAVLFANQADQRTDRGDFETGTGNHFSVTGSTVRQLEDGNIEDGNIRDSHIDDRRQDPAAQQPDPAAADRGGQRDSDREHRTEHHG